MKKRNIQSISQVLDDYVKSLNLENGLHETRLLNAFPEIVGPGISAHIRNLTVRNGILYISLDSSVIRNELLMMRQSLINLLNKKAGKDILTDIVFR